VAGVGADEPQRLGSGSEVTRLGAVQFLVAVLVATLMVASCTGAPVPPASTPAVPTIGSPALPSQTVQSNSPARASAAGADILGTWTRTQSCDEQLAAFVAKGLATQEAYRWVTANWVPGNPPPTPKGQDYCAGARPPVAHSHFFAAGYRFGSLDENGSQVDFGDYSIKSPGVLTFPKHSVEFGYAGEIMVGYIVDDGQATFDVLVPKDCAADARCSDAYGWALSAFFGPAPWHRSG
jgi:hypothetical protein